MGYHFFKVRPHPDIPMKVEMGEDNIRDPKAMAIKMPSADNIHQSLHKEIRGRNKARKEQSVCDLLENKLVGCHPIYLNSF